jgi:hypothetical protein
LPQRLQRWPWELRTSLPRTRAAITITTITGITTIIMAIIITTAMGITTITTATITAAGSAMVTCTGAMATITAMGIGTGGATGTTTESA